MFHQPGVMKQILNGCGDSHEIKPQLTRKYLSASVHLSIKEKLYFPWHMNNDLSYA
jgi:hypothetical protein